MRSYNNSSCENLINQISPEILETLTEQQIEAIYRGFGSRSKANHCIDLRICIPIPRLRLYLLLLAGWERRSERRLLNNKGVYPMLTPVNFLFLMGFFGVILCSTFILLSFIRPSMKMPSLSSHPTSIPWIDNKYECEKTYRKWENNKCWDDQHNRDF